MFLILRLVFFMFNVHHNNVVICIPTLNGRYTREIEEFYLTIPHKLSFDGEFLSYDIPNFFNHNFNKRKSKRSIDDPDIVNYGIKVNDTLYHTELWPNHDFISPDIVFEKRSPKLKVEDREIRKLNKGKLCHYTGRIRDYPESKVALSTCNGLAGYITLRNKRYFIEPLQEHEPNNNGQHLHIIYENHPASDKLNDKRCGTTNNWESAWKKRFTDNYKNNNSANMPRRDTASVHRYLETLVVGDKKFLDHHKNNDYETYILTIMNMVSDFYHDYSSGNQMDVVVVRIIYLHKEEEEIDLTINPNADDTLASFCKWQQKINPKDVTNPNHHDIAVLLTRYDICSDNLSNCGLMGLAYVASACTGNEPCAITEDSGLVLGIVVAHEMGHIMGCAHDKEGESTCPAQDADESFYVMAPYVHLFTTRWSTCSKTFITSLFENGLGDCLNDEPEISLYRDRNMLPGAIYDAEAQCQMTFPNSTPCPGNRENFCKMLLCQISPTTCMSNEEPPADGTKCGENKWCYKKKCVEIGKRPEAINGGWGDWGSFSDCSRTCGGGVAIAKRECNNPIPQHGGRYCIGERKKIRTCNMDPCPLDSPSFRDVQCAEFNNREIHGKKLQWKSFFVKDEPCVLYCSNNENNYSKLLPRVKDGTRCEPGTKNMCIGGVCRKIGCDGNLDSTAVDDICGICNGDGTLCTIIEKMYKDPPGYDYVKVATIPAGSRSILIEELKPSENTIAISDKTETKFYLNGDHSENNDGEIKIDNLEAFYSHPEENQEFLKIPGPLKDDIVFYVTFYGPENVGYLYKYTQPSSTSYKPQYHWEQLDWNDCSVRCGGGIQTSRISCVEEKAGKVSSKFCKDLDKLEELTQKCNEQPCKTKWKIGKWGKCHACKYKSGVRKRQVVCIQESPHSGTDEILVEDSQCKGPKPGTRELCNSHKKCKTRRFTDGLPDHMMKDVWKQISSNNRREKRLKPIKYMANKKQYKKQLDYDTFPMKNEIHNHSKPEVGSIVKDIIPSQEIKVIEVPLKQSHLSLNLSDSQFETIGDDVGDSINTNQAKIATGENAVKIMEKLEHRYPTKGKRKT